MQFGNRRGSSNVSDRRGMGGMAMGGGLGAVVLTILALVLGVDPDVVTQGGQAPSGPAAAPPADDPKAQFVTQVLGTTEEVWTAVFQEEFGQDYPEPTLVLFSGATGTACGTGQSAMGPFYCPLDQQVYIDLSFYQELEQRLGAGGDFAQAYVIAHEVGHHVQTVTGISEQVQQQGRGRSQEEVNQLSVRQELQADCYAGVWGNRVRNLQGVVIDPGDLEEAMNAASAIGDDKLQQQGQGYVVPESFTHGSSQQRMTWFNRGYQSGDINQCDTFAARSL
jgi:uncharacterized protein